MALCDWEIHNTVTLSYSKPTCAYLKTFPTLVTGCTLSAGRNCYQISMTADGDESFIYVHEEEFLATLLC